MTERVRFDSIDAVRGLGALAVVVWHWQHVVLLNGSKYTWPPVSGPDRSIEPFYPLLRTFYEYGFWAVDLFFVISGFIFFLLYRESIAAKRTPAKDFFLLRVSRLYPLHLITLLVVAGLQFLFWRQTQQTFVYLDNDAPHFIANLFLINAPEFAFNAPTWAITVEIALYILFWPLARLGLLKHWLAPLALFVAGLWMLLYPDWGLWGRGVAGFFAGGLACFVFVRVRESRAWLTAFAIASALGWAVTIALVYLQPVFGAGLSRDANVALHLGLRWSMLYLLFPATIMALAMWDAQRKTRIAPFAFLGSISYAAYVVHFPMQLCVALAVAYGFLARDVGLNPLAFVAFFVVLIALARAGFVLIEEPAQLWLRQKLLPKPA